MAEGCGLRRGRRRNGEGYAWACVPRPACAQVPDPSSARSLRIGGDGQDRWGPPIVCGQQGVGGRRWRVGSGPMWGVDSARSAKGSDFLSILGKMIFQLQNKFENTLKIF